MSLESEEGSFQVSFRRPDGAVQSGMSQKVITSRIQEKNPAYDRIKQILLIPLVSPGRRPVKRSERDRKTVLAC